jgi:hypothetical protein
VNVNGAECEYLYLNRDTKLAFEYSIMVAIERLELDRKDFPENFYSRHFASPNKGSIHAGAKSIATSGDGGSFASRGSVASHSVSYSSPSYFGSLCSAIITSRKIATNGHALMVTIG